jgi:hypothetical protein
MSPNVLNGSKIKSFCYATNQIQRRVWSYLVIIKEKMFAFVPFTLKITRYGVHWRAPINISKISIKLFPSFKFFIVKPYFLPPKLKFGINKIVVTLTLGLQFRTKSKTKIKLWLNKRKWSIWTHKLEGVWKLNGKTLKLLPNHNSHYGSGTPKKSQFVKMGFENHNISKWSDI